VMARKGS